MKEVLMQAILKFEDRENHIWIVRSPKNFIDYPERLGSSVYFDASFLGKELNETIYECMLGEQYCGKLFHKVGFTQ
jgi:hypothetical protein